MGDEHVTFELSAVALARIITEARAEAWDQGYALAGGQADWGHDNPYRQASKRALHEAWIAGTLQAPCPCRDLAGDA